jgi:MFS family permease
MAAAPNLVVLTVGWIVASIGFSTTINSVLMSQADRLPEAQRGKVAGLSGFITMLSSVVGVGLAAPFAGNNFLLFLVPGGVGLLLVLLWVFFVPEASSLHAEVRAKLGLRGTLKGLVFNPKQHPDFAWNWLGRVLFQTGVSFATAFTTLFFASRLSPTGQVADITGFITMLALIGVIASAGGAFASGFLSDKFQRRRIFVLIAGIMFTAGALTMAFGGSNPVLLVVGSVVTSTGLGIFSTVDQAIILDILPVEDAGRFIGINGYSTALAQAIAPALAVPLLLIGVTGTDKNYGLLLVVAGVISMIGGLIVVLKVRKAK